MKETRIIRLWVELEETPKERSKKPYGSLRNSIKRAINAVPGFCFRRILPTGVPSIWDLDDPDDPPEDFC